MEGEWIALCLFFSDVQTDKTLHTIVSFGYFELETNHGFWKNTLIFILIKNHFLELTRRITRTCLSKVYINISGLSDIRKQEVKVSISRGKINLIVLSLFIQR